MANGSTPFTSAEIQSLFKQPAHVLYLLITYLGGLRRLKSLAITVHVVQRTLLNFTNCFYMLSVKVLVCTALSLVCVVIYAYNLSPWFAVGSLLLKPASLGSILDISVQKGKVWRFL